MHEFPIIIKLGGRSAVFAALRDQHGMDLTLDALRKWTVRKRIPGDAVPPLMRLAKTAGFAVEAEDLELQTIAKS